jgi:hypothetical protein
VGLCLRQRLINPKGVRLPNSLSLEHQGSRPGCSLYRIHLWLDPRACPVSLSDVLSELGQAVLLHNRDHASAKASTGLPGTDDAKPLDNGQIRLSTS